MKKPIFAVALLALACGPSDRELATIAERDDLLADVLEQATLINEINLELARVQDSATGMNLATEEGLNRAAEENQVTLERVRNLIARLDVQEQVLEDRRARIQTLAGSETRLLQRVREYEATVTQIREQAEAREGELLNTIEQQRSMIVALSTQLTDAQDENETLVATNVGLTEEVAGLTTDANTVYYVAGTKDELKERGIIVEEGRKFLFFGSKTVQPSRQLNPEDFTAIDMREVTNIVLPEADKDYRIVTRQSHTFLETAQEDGKVRESLTITEPEHFWSASKFLILVQS